MTTRFAISLAASLLAGTPAAVHAASFTTYLNRTAFNAAAGNVAVENFDRFASETAIGNGLDAGAFSVRETHFGTYGGGAKIGSGAAAGNLNGTNYIAAQLYDGSAAYGSYLTFTFDSPITAFGGNWASGSVNFIYLDVLGQKVDQMVATTGGFFGFISDTPFTTVVMRARASNHQASLDNLTYSAAAVPEVASWVMMVSGFGMIGSATRSRRKSSVTFA